MLRLGFVGFGGTLGGIAGSFLASATAHSLRISGLLFLAATILIFSANLSIEMGKIMYRHWEEQQIVRNWEEFILQAAAREREERQKHQQQQEKQQQERTRLLQFSPSTLGRAGHGLEEFQDTLTDDFLVMDQVDDHLHEDDIAPVDSSIKKSISTGCMLNSIQAGMTQQENSISSALVMDPTIVELSMKRVGSLGSMKRVASGNSLANVKPLSGGMTRAKSGTFIQPQFPSSRASQPSSHKLDIASAMKRVKSGPAISSLTNSLNPSAKLKTQLSNSEYEDVRANSFSQRLLRGVTTILRSRLLMAIFTYNALYASTTVLLSFQRAELVANRKSSGVTNTESDTAFLARINVASNVAVFALQASGLGAFMAHSLGQRGTLAIMPCVRMGGVLSLAWWHIVGHGRPPNLTLFLILDEFTRVINFAVAKPVREGLWRGLSNEARYEAKPIVDTLANRWGSGSAAVLMSLMDRMLTWIGWILHQNMILDSTITNSLSAKTFFGFPPLLILCLVIAAWWVMVSLHLGHIRKRIDIELKKHQ